MDITLPTSSPSSVTVEFQSSGVPVGATVALKLTPPIGSPTTVQSSPLAGTTANATASATISVPLGHSVFSATVTYTIVASLGDALKNFAGNERVERVTLTAGLSEPTKVALTTVSGKQFEVPAEVLQLAQAGRL